MKLDVTKVVDVKTDWADSKQDAVIISFRYRDRTISKHRVAVNGSGPLYLLQVRQFLLGKVFDARIQRSRR